MDDVVELDVPWIPDAGAPRPLLVATEHTARVICRPAVIAPTTEPLMVLQFPRCWALSFGYPNDEALPGHPLYAKGVRHYGVFEVLESSWQRQLEVQNRVAFPTTTAGAPSRHFVVTFHDSTLECLADRIEGRFSASFADASQRREDDPRFPSA